MIIKSIEDVKSFKKDAEVHSLIYRGQTNSIWPMVPKLFREKQTIANSAKYEIACFRPYLHNKAKYFIHYNSPIEHLINLQHYDGSTRLLDFTTNFYTAVFFACYDPFLNNKDQNGKVFALHPDFFETYFSQSFNFYFMESTMKECKRILDVDRFYLIDPKVKNPRMIRQDGLFLMFPLRKLSGYDDNIPIRFDDYLKEENLIRSKQNNTSLMWCAHIEIDSNSKEQILKELDEEFGINPETIYEHEITTEEIKSNYKGMLEEIDMFYNNVLLKSNE